MGVLTSVRWYIVMSDQLDPQDAISYITLYHIISHPSVSCGEAVHGDERPVELAEFLGRAVRVEGNPHDRIWNTFYTRAQMCVNTGTGAQMCV